MLHPVTLAHERSNVHPNYRRLHLNHLRQLRSFMKDRPGQRFQFERLIKRAQAEAASARERLHKARAELGL